MKVLRVVAALLLLAGCGPQEVKEKQEVTVRTIQLSLPTVVYQPPQQGKLPLVLFIHGYTRRPEDYDLLLRQWAAKGFVVAAPTMSRTARGSSPLDIEDLINQPAAATAVLTGLLELDAKTGDPLFDRLDTAKVVAAGHSLGGMTTVGMFTKFRDERLRGGIVLAGAPRAVGTDYRGSPANLLFVHGRVDTVVPIEQGREAYDPAPWPKVMLELKYGDHLGPYLGTQYDEFQAVAIATTDFLLWTLRDDAEAKKRLDALS